MKTRAILSVVAAAMIVGMVPATAGAQQTGNGAPQAQLLGSLNIIGVASDKNANMDNAGGAVIFVGLGSDGEPERTNIYLEEGEDFAVLDKNGTDGEARFQLPAPGIDPYVIGGDMTGVDTETDYSVFIRPLGKPGGFSTITTCAELVDGTGAGLFGMLPNAYQKEILNRMDESSGAYCSVEQVGSDITLRQKGKSVFTNVTAQLLTIVFQVELTFVDAVTGDVTIQVYYVRVPIFDSLLQGEYWEYENHGLRLLQVRFYDVATDVVTADGPYGG